MAISQVALAAMKFDAGFDIDIESFAHCDQAFRDIINLFEEQKLKKLMATRIKLPVMEIKEWVYTAKSVEESVISGQISGNEVNLSPQILSEVFELANGECGLEINENEFAAALIKMGCNVENPSKLLKKNFSAEYKLLADIVGKVLLAKTSAHDYVTRHQFLLMVALVEKKNVNWSAILI